MKNKLKHFFKIGLGILAVVFLIGCRSEERSVDTIQQQDVGVVLSINGEEVEFFLSDDENSSFFSKVLHTDRPNEILLKSDGVEVNFDGIPLVRDQVVQYELEELRKDTSIPIIIKSNVVKKEKQYYMITLDHSIADFEFYSNGAEDGYYYLTSGNYLVKVDTKGNYVYYKNCGVDVHDFKRTEVEGEVYYFYVAGTKPENLPNYNSVNYKFVTLHVMDSNYKEIDTVKYLIPGDDIPEKWPLEMHDHIIVGKNHYFVVGMVPTYVDNIPDDVKHSSYQTRVLAAVIQEIKDGQLVWEWNSIDHPELYAMSHESCDYTNETIQWNDYCHLNSIEVDPKDGNILCSFRNLDSIVKLDYKTGDILWCLGGKADDFGLSKEQEFSGQHFARYVDDNTITIWDNAINYISYPHSEPYQGSATGYPRTVKISLNENTKEILSYEEYNMGRLGGEFMGSTQLMGEDTYLIGWGGSVQNPNFAVFTEMDFANNNILFEGVVTANNTFSNYRVYKYKD